MRTSRVVRIASAICLSVAVAACAAKAKPAPQAVPRAAPASAAVNENLHAVLWTQTSVEYRAVAAQSYALARLRLDEALKRADWTAALEQTGDFGGLPPAVIADVDETVLDNSRYQARLVQTDTEFAEATWNEYVAEAVSDAVPGAVEFARAAAERGVTVFYITNRQHVVEDATRTNLARLGFPLDAAYDTVFTLAERPEWKSSDKSARRQAVAAAYRIILLIGDDFGDFVPARVSLAERTALFEKHAAMWGERWIMLPNPQYGSWEGSLFGHKSGLARAEKLRLKFEHLRAH